MRHEDGSTGSQYPSAPSDALWFDGRGLCVAGVPPQPCIAASTNSGRLELLLALAFGRRLPSQALAQVVKAAEESRRGDHALANLRLAFAGLSRVPSHRDLPGRLERVDALLAKGVTAAEILDALFKFDPEQPRVPAGSGAESGRWTSGGGAANASAAAVAVDVGSVAARTAPLFTPEIGAGALAALSGVAAAAGAAVAVGGVLFVPWQNGTSSTGPLPGDADHSYTYNSDEGLLQVRDSAGTVVAAGHKDAAGIFRDADTDAPFARELGGALMFDGVFATAQSEDNAAGLSQTDGASDDEPKLCPDPGADQPGRASKRARAYQEQISRMINPQRPLPFGLAMNLPNPVTGKLVHYDECAEQTGTMIEAKGPGFDRILSFAPGQNNVTRQWLGQSLREVQAAGSRQVGWYFAEQYAADYARAIFRQADVGREHIVVKVQPAEVQ